MYSIRDCFPELPPDSYEITSDATFKYNSVAWSIGEEEMDRCWWPVPYWEEYYYWPAEREHTLCAFENVYLALGYERCNNNEDPEPGFQKVAIYVDNRNRPTHVARQLFKRNESKWVWASKVIELEDIEHESLSALNKAFGSVATILRLQASGQGT